MDGLSAGGVVGLDNTVVRERWERIGVRVYLVPRALGYAGLRYEVGYCLEEAIRKKF